MSPRTRAVKLLLEILQHQGKLTSQALASRIGMDRSNVLKCIKDIEKAGIDVIKDSGHNYSVQLNNSIKELKRLQALSESDVLFISAGLDASDVSNSQRLAIINKIESLLDIQALGLKALRKPELEKIEILEKAKDNKTQVKLVKYKSNSNTIKDRTVECFDINTEAGMIQVYDEDSEKIRHFKLSRIERVERLNKLWIYESYHKKKTTDVFRIADNDVLPVHLELNVFGYNSLIEAFPQARAYTHINMNGTSWSFEGNVNHQFLGLKQFILSNSENVKIIQPSQLSAKINKEAKLIFNKFT